MARRAAIDAGIPPGGRHGEPAQGSAPNLGRGRRIRPHGKTAMRHAQQGAAVPVDQIDASAASAEPLQILVQAYNASGVDIFQRLASSPGNIAFSPLSIGTAMAMALAGARDDTQSEMAKVLRQKLAPSEIGPANAQLMATLDEETGAPNSATKLTTAKWSSRHTVFARFRPKRTQIEPAHGNRLKLKIAHDGNPFDAPALRLKGPGAARGIVLPKSEEYRHYGAQCMQLASHTVDPDDKALLVAIAEGWRVLAERARTGEPEDVAPGPPDGDQARDPQPSKRMRFS